VKSITIILRYTTTNSLIIENLVVVNYICSTINYISLDETNINSLISDLETPAFGYDRKIIVAKDTGLFKKEKRTSKKTTTKEVEDVGKKKSKKRK